MPSQGDIVLIPIPFTDLSSQKRRPVIVISNDEYNRTGPDVVVVAMTSNPASSPYSFVSAAHLAQGADPPRHRPCRQNLHAGQVVIVKTFGRVNDRTLDRIRAALAELTIPRA